MGRFATHMGHFATVHMAPHACMGLFATHMGRFATHMGHFATHEIFCNEAAIEELLQQSVRPFCNIGFYATIMRKYAERRQLCKNMRF